MQFMDRGEPLTIKILFTEHALEEFDLTLEYWDAAEERGESVRRCRQVR
jgi:hypothetical protein